MAAKQLFAANRIGLFAALAGGERDATGLAADLGVPRAVVRILGDSLTAVGLLTREDGRYGLTGAARAYLTGPGADHDLGPYLRFLEEISYPHWLQFDRTVSTGAPGELDVSGDRWSVFLAGVMAYNGLHARMLAQRLDFTPYRTALDLGGLSCEFAVAAMAANPQLRTTFLYDPAMTAALTEQLAELGFADRTAVEAVPTVEARPTGDADLVLVNHVIHRFDADQNRAILTAARAGARTGARLVLLDFFLDDDPSPRALDALHAAEYLVIDGTVVYPEDEVRGWCSAAGWWPLERITLPGSPRLLLCEAV
ncbi:MAG: polyketide biosynthesis methyltransferase [Actinobacteria bacterium]|nr:polyketide biosynthesis methyltransferase [Actinomycetota bacterium]